MWFLDDIEAAACEKPSLRSNVQAETRMGLSLTLPYYNLGLGARRFKSKKFTMNLTPFSWQ